ncbi:hypothetical protein HDU96_001055, partial [Phlyctochytrium bullatum]
MEVDLEGEAHGDQAPPPCARPGPRPPKKARPYRSTFKLGRLRYSGKWNQFYKPAEPIRERQQRPPLVHRGYDERRRDLRRHVRNRGIYKYAAKMMMQKTVKVVKQFNDVSYLFMDVRTYGSLKAIFWRCRLMQRFLAWNADRALEELRYLRRIPGGAAPAAGGEGAEGAGEAAAPVPVPAVGGGEPAGGGAPPAGGGEPAGGGAPAAQAPLVEFPAAAPEALYVPIPEEELDYMDAGPRTQSWIRMGFNKNLYAEAACKVKTDVKNFVGGELVRLLKEVIRSFLRVRHPDPNQEITDRRQRRIEAFILTPAIVGAYGNDDYRLHRESPILFDNADDGPANVAPGQLGVPGYRDSVCMFLEPIYHLLRVALYQVRRLTPDPIPEDWVDANAICFGPNKIKEWNKWPTLARRNDKALKYIILANREQAEPGQRGPAYKAGKLVPSTTSHVDRHVLFDFRSVWEYVLQRLQQAEKTLSLAFVDHRDPNNPRLFRGNSTPSAYEERLMWASILGLHERIGQISEDGQTFRKGGYDVPIKSLRFKTNGYEMQLVVLFDHEDPNLPPHLKERRVFTIEEVKSVARYDEPARSPGMLFPNHAVEQQDPGPYLPAHSQPAGQLLSMAKRPGMPLERMARLADHEIPLLGDERTPFGHAMEDRMIAFQKAYPRTHEEDGGADEGVVEELTQ